jgi:hypothetical protein
MNNESGLIKLQEALSRLKSKSTTILPVGSKITARNVEIEADMGNGSAYYYPEFVDEIKLAKAAQPKTGRQPKKIKTNKSISTADKQKQLTQKNDELTKSNKRVLVAQSELVYNLFKSCDDPKFIIDAYEHTNNVLPIK